jgi:hypothetical protein
MALSVQMCHQNALAIAQLKDSLLEAIRSNREGLRTDSPVVNTSNDNPTNVGSITAIPIAARIPAAQDTLKDGSTPRKKARCIRENTVAQAECATSVPRIVLADLNLHVKTRDDFLRVIQIWKTVLKPHEQTVGCDYRTDKAVKDANGKSWKSNSKASNWNKRKAIFELYDHLMDSGQEETSVMNELTTLYESVAPSAQGRLLKDVKKVFDAELTRRTGCARVSGRPPKKPKRNNGTSNTTRQQVPSVAQPTFEQVFGSERYPEKVNNAMSLNIDDSDPSILHQEILETIESNRLAQLRQQRQREYERDIAVNEAMRPSVLQHHELQRQLEQHGLRPHLATLQQRDMTYQSLRR